MFQLNCPQGAGRFKVRVFLASDKREDGSSSGNTEYLLMGSPLIVTQSWKGKIKTYQAPTNE